MRNPPCFIAPLSLLRQLHFPFLVTYPMSNRRLFALIIILSFLGVITLSCVSLFSLAPAYKKLIIKNTEVEAVKIARHLQDVLLVEESHSRVSPAPDFDEQARIAVQDFGLMKIKLFASDGKTIFSTDGKDIGIVNQHDYFHINVARGEVVTKVIRKDQKSLEGLTVTADVVETYVPIMSAGSFLGAFEIYLDITENFRALDDLLRRSNTLMLLVAAGLLLGLLIISWKAVLNFIAHEKAELKIAAQSKELQTKNDELSVINDVSRVLSTSIDLNDLLPKILQTVIERLSLLRLLHKGGIMLLNGERLELVAHLEHPDSFFALHENLTINDCLCGLAARTGELVYSSNSHEDKAHTVRYQDMEPHGHIIVPLLSGNKVLGVLYLYLPASTEVDESNRELLMSLGNQIGMAVDNARLYEETKRLSLRDPLTGVANRRCLETNLKEAIDLADRYRQPLTVAMLDIDYFKQYNDTYGHSAGDKILVRVAQKLTSLSRVVDQVARYGGEEFLLILPESDLNSATIAAERVREAIWDALRITVSIGLAQYRSGRSPDELVMAADKALYRAKQNGRNRIECELPEE